MVIYGLLSNELPAKGVLRNHALRWKLRTCHPASAACHYKLGQFKRHYTEALPKERETPHVPPHEEYECQDIPNSKLTGGFMDTLISYHGEIADLATFPIPVRVVLLTGPC